MRNERDPKLLDRPRPQNTPRRDSGVEQNDGEEAMKKLIDAKAMLDEINTQYLPYAGEELEAAAKQEGRTTSHE